MIGKNKKYKKKLNFVETVCTATPNTRTPHLYSVSQQPTEYDGETNYIVLIL